MAELVEQRAGIVEAEERRVALRKIHDVDDDRPDIAREALLRAERAHPRAAALRRPCEVVSDEDTDVIALCVLHGPDSDVGVVSGSILQFAEAETEQASSGLECGLYDALELEVRLDLGLVEVVPFPANLLGIIPPIPRLDLHVVAPGLGELLKILPLAGGPAEGRRPDLAQEREDVLGGLRPRVGELEGRERLVAQKSRTLGAKANHLGD